jgi:hypothetical protein
VRDDDQVAIYVVAKSVVRAMRVLHCALVLWVFRALQGQIYCREEGGRRGINSPRRYHIHIASQPTLEAMVYSDSVEDRGREAEGDPATIVRNKLQICQIDQFEPNGALDAKGRDTSQ